VILAVGAGSARRTATVLLGCYRPFGWGPIRREEPAELQLLRRELADAVAGSEFAAALSPHARILMFELMGLSDDSYRFVSEVFITDGALARGAVDVFGILLHEAAHMIADSRGINDTSRQGRYHNGRFRAVAEEVGLQGDRDPVAGWSLINLSQQRPRCIRPLSPT
jgi:hypothetical protein